VSGVTEVIEAMVRAVPARKASLNEPQVVCASTGKALRPYSPETYTASKRAAEWTASVAAARGGHQEPASCGRAKPDRPTRTARPEAAGRRRSWPRLNIELPTLGNKASRIPQYPRIRK